MHTPTRVTSHSENQALLIHRTRHTPIAIELPDVVLKTRCRDGGGPGYPLGAGGGVDGHPATRRER